MIYHLKLKMEKFSEIFTFLKKRKRLLNEFHKAEREVEKKVSRIKKLEKPFFDCEIDPYKYFMFFNKYYIAFRKDTERYFVKDIHLTKDCDGNDFYEATYEYMRLDLSGKVADSYKSDLSLRKFLHLLDRPDAELKQIEEK